MIESVSTSYVQGASLRVNPQVASAYAVSSTSSADVTGDLPRGTRLYVRLDSSAQRAILEVRSSETGEVVKQYPSEAQMRAFQRAASLKEGQDKARAEAAAEVQARQDAAADAAATAQAAQPSSPQSNVAVSQPSPVQVAQAAASVSSVSTNTMPASGGMLV